MNKKIQLARNRLFNLLIIAGIFLFVIGLAILSEPDVVAFGIIALLISVAFIGYALIFQPFCYLFDQDGVSLCYLFIHNERYLWKNIHRITLEFDHSLDNFWYLQQYFELSGNAEGKRLFYMNGHIRRSRHTKKLIEKYWDGTVTGYFTEDIKQWWNKRHSKKQKEIDAHLTDEIVPMERECRAKFRNALKPFIDRANLIGLDIKVEYLYINDDFDEFKTRPNENYDYTALIEISEKGSTNEDNTVYLYNDLIHVRLGRKAYRGVENSFALEELNLTLNETLDQIQSLGIAEIAQLESK